MDGIAEYNINEIARQYFLHGVKRGYYVSDYGPYVESSTTVWSVPNGRTERGIRYTFKAMTKKRLGRLALGHQVDIENYRKRMYDEDTDELPEILVRITDEGERIVVDGNRRCCAWMLLPEPMRKDIRIPAFVLDHRETPWG